MLLRLKVENWANKEDFEVKFKEGCNLIFGPNYSGKSSLLNAAFYALTGILPHGLAPGFMVRKGAGEAVVELDFQDSKGDVYRVRRVIKAGRKKGDAHLYPLVNGEEREEIMSGDREVSEEVLKRLGVGLGYFLRVVFMREGDVYRFLTKPEKGLQEEFNRILGIDRVTFISKELSKLGRDMKRKIGDLERKIKDVRGKVGEESVEELERRLREIEEELGKLDQEIIEMSQRKKELDEKLRLIEELESLERKIGGLKKKMEDIVRDIPGEGGYRERLENFLKVKREEFENMKKEVEDLKVKIESLKLKVDDLKMEIEKLKDVITACPTCERPLTREEAKVVIKKKEKRIQQLNVDISEKKNMLKVKREELDVLKRFVADLEERKRDLDSVLEDIRKINERINELRRIVRERRGEVEKELRRIDSELKLMNTKRDELLIEKGKVKEKIEASKVKLEKLERKLKDLVHKHYVTELFVKACNNTAEEVGKFVLDQVKREAASIWGKVRGGVWEVDWDKKLLPFLKSGSVEYMAEQLSGAEKIVLFVALRVSLARRLGNPGFLIFDEPVEHLDEKNKEFLKEILLRLPEEGVKQLIVASCDERILEAKWDNVVKLSF